MKITLVNIKKDNDIYLSIVKKLKDDYLESFMTMDEFGIKYGITHDAIKYALNKSDLKKDMSKWNVSKKPGCVDKIKQTKLDRYGDSKYNNQEKNKKTCLEKYGVESIHQLDKINEQKKRTFNSHYPKDSDAYNKLIKNRVDKRNRTLKKIDYGEVIRESRYQHALEDPTFLENIQKKRIETCLDKYGVDNVSCVEGVKDKKKQTNSLRIETFEKKNNCTQYIKLIRKYGESWVSIIEDLKTYYDHNNVYISNDDINKLEKYVSKNHTARSCCEKEISTYVKSIYNGIIYENDRSMITPKELDIYIPDKKVAIEYNGLYWHAFDKNKQLDKTIACEERNIRLLHIFEDQWKFKKNICKSLIASSLGIYDERIFARNCECKKIDSKTYRDFLNENHIQGEVNSSIKLGLFYKDRLVQVAGWGKSRFKKGEMELHRMCTLNHAQVIGGFSKLIKHSNLNSFISYIDRSLFNGSGYKECGFKLEGTTPPSYFYSKGSVQFNRINRLSAQKHKLKNLKNYDESKTEKEIMLKNGFFQVYDCGNLKVSYIINNKEND